MDRPILLLEKDNDSKWRVTEQAEQQLQSMDNLIGVISIAGIKHHLINLVEILHRCLVMFITQSFSL